MKAEGRIFFGFVCFMAIATVAYWTLSHEVAGTTALAFTTFMTFLVGYYLLFTARRIDPRPEDDAYAEISDGAGDLGVFSPHSWMPLAVAASASITALGTIFGWWLAIAGFFFLILSVMGFVFEFYRGDHAH
jgi:Cytochrome c oxidase subunit IV